MRPILYDKTGTVKLGELTNCIECLVEEERNGLFEVSLIYPTNDTLFNSLEEENIIVCNANDTLLNQKFRIYMTRKLMSNRIEVFARHISFDLAYDYVDNIDIENQSCEYALNTIFRSSQFSTHYKGHSDIINAQDYKISKVNCIEAIGGTRGSIIDTFGTGAEILRDNTNIHVLNKRGHDNGVSIEYAKNLTGFELEEDYSELITRIIPFASYSDSETNEEILVEGNAVDSDYISNYSHPYISYMDFSEKFGDEEIPTTEKLVNLAKKYFKNNNCDKPKQNFKIEFVPLSKCVGYEGIQDKISLCDTVTIKDTRFNIDTQAKVIKTVFNVLKNKYESMELGEPRTTLGDIINSSGGSGESGEQGPPGPQGPPGADGIIGDFPNSLPSTPVLSANVYGFASIELNWTYENKVYYNYELYGSKTKDFTPNSFDLIHAGQSSSFLFQAKPNETWYFKVCAINSHGNRTGFSNQVTVVTRKIDDMSNYFEDAAIGNAVIGTLTSDYMEAGIIKGHYIDAKNLSVTDGNGKRTLDIDSFGNVNLDVTSLKISSSNIASEDYVNNKMNDLQINSINKVETWFYISNSSLSITGGSWSTTSPTNVSEGKFVWTKTKTYFTDGSVTETTPFCITAVGANGVGIDSVVNYYLATNKSSGVTSSTSGWTTTVQAINITNKYLWNYEEIRYTNGSITTTIPCVIGTYGTDGSDGRGISSIAEYYLATTVSSGVTASTSGWTTNIQTITESKRFLWNYEKTTYTDGTITSTSPVVIGVYGQSGTDGKGISSIVTQYYLSSSKTTQTGGSWVITCPTWVSGKYLWIRYYITYTDNTTSYTSPFVDASWEKVNDLEDTVNEIESRVTTAEQKITSDAIISTVPSSTTWKTQTNNITTAQNTANTAKTTANTANTTANTNKTNISNLTSRVSTAEQKITADAIVSTVTSSSTYKNALTGKVDTNKVISSINQTAESIKIQANKIQLEGAVSVSNSSGNSVKINNADYEIRNGSTTKAFFGLRTLDDDGREIPRFALGSSGLNKNSHNYFAVTHYPANNNPLSTNQTYADMTYRTHKYTTSDTSGDISNIRMLDDGDIHLAPVRNLLIKSSFTNGYHNANTDETTLAEFGTYAGDYTRYMETACIRRDGTSKGLILANYNDSGYNAMVRLCIDSSNYRFFAPINGSADISLGSPSYLWQRVCASQGAINTSDRNLKDNIEYIQETLNPKARKSESYSIKDMYDFVKDDLSMATYTMKDDKEQKLKYGFIAQDIINTKIGENIVYQDNNEEGSFLGYDTMNYTSALAGALKQAINEIEKLKEEINNLKNNN